MNVLAVDTSTMVQTAAVAEWAADAGLDTEPTWSLVRSHRVAKGHSAQLLATIDGLLSEASLGLVDVDLIVVGRGPGSFTGLRIGVASTKALAFAAERPIVAVSSLAAMAFRAPVSGPPGLIVTANDARKREVYAAVWQLDAAGWPKFIVAPGTFQPSGLAQALRDCDGHASQSLPRYGVGNGFSVYQERFATSGLNVQLLPEWTWAPQPMAVAFLGRSRYLCSGATPLEELEPQYIRASDAELNWGKPKAKKSLLAGQKLSRRQRK